MQTQHPAKAGGPRIQWNEGTEEFCSEAVIGGAEPSAPPLPAAHGISLSLPLTCLPSPVTLSLYSVPAPLQTLQLRNRLHSGSLARWCREWEVTQDEAEGSILFLISSGDMWKERDCHFHLEGWGRRLLSTPAHCPWESQGAAATGQTLQVLTWRLHPRLMTEQWLSSWQVLCWGCPWDLTGLSSWLVGVAKFRTSISDPLTGIR